MPKVFLLIDSRVWQLVVDADPVAKGVLAILAFISVLSWAVIINKIRVFRRARSESDQFLASFRRRRRIADVYANLVSLRHTPLARIFAEGFKDLEHLQRKEAHNPRPVAIVRGEAVRGAAPAEDDLLGVSQIDALRLTLSRVAGEELARYEKTVTVLATTGNVAPFFGLLGTIWGVIDAFLSIGIRGQANLAVVAPGIAEALIATIVGLAAAIPAVMGYNYCVSRLRELSGQMDNFTLELLTAFLKEQ